MMAADKVSATGVLLLDAGTRADLEKQLNHFVHNDAPTLENIAAKRARIAELERVNSLMDGELKEKTQQLVALERRCAELEAGYEDVRSSLFGEAYGRADHPEWKGTAPLDKARLEGVNDGISLAIGTLDETTNRLGISKPPAPAEGGDGDCPF